VRQRLLSRLALLSTALLWLPISAAAQEQEETEPIQKTEEARQAEEAADQEEEESRFSGIFQVDFSNAYFFRGILQERDSFIAQPWLEGYFSLWGSEDGFIRDISIGAGVWSSFHTEETLATDNPKSLYEVDWYPVIAVEFPAGVSFTTIYYWYTSPNDAFAHVQEWNFKFAWDDSEYLGRFALQPWVNFAIEMHNTSLAPKQGQGMQMGIEPTLFEVPIENYPITVTAPVELGLSLDDYYERPATGHENTFGYASYGIKASVPLAFMPEKAGSWTFSMSGKGYSLGHSLANANLGRDFTPVGVASIAVEF
jgi:hypothetical protein